MLIKRKVFVIQIDVRIVEIRHVLGVLGVPGVKPISALILVVDAVVEQPVRDDELFLAFDQVSSQSA